MKSFVGDSQSLQLNTVSDWQLMDDCKLQIIMHTCLVPVNNQTMEFCTKWGL